VVFRWRQVAPLLLTVGLMAAGAGCAPSRERRDAVAAVAQRLLTAVAAGDGAAACDLLAPQTRAVVEASAGKACADAVLDGDLPASGAVRRVDVYGQWARVVMSGDTLFLASFGAGWRVVAAGCQPRGERPYDCRVQGN
jgi:hypothetical protein